MRISPALMIAMVVAGPAPASLAQAAGDAARGERIATVDCARCHVIPGRKNFGIGNTPSFKIMVQSKAADWRHKFEVFYTLRPHPNFIRIKELPKLSEYPAIAAPVEMSLEDIPHLMAYVDKLARQFRKDQ